MTTSATTVRPRTRTGVLSGLADPATYRRTLHLLADLPLGLATFTLATTLLALAAGLAVTLVGLPVLVLTLAAARGLGQVERARARILLGLDVPAPSQPHGWRARLADAAGWRALGYALLLGPVGLLTGTLTLFGWAAAVGALTYPVYAWTLADPAVHLGGLTFGGAPAAVASVLVGLLLLAVLPSLVRLLARVDAVLIRTLLR
jgi:hypothetical protein